MQLLTKSQKHKLMFLLAHLLVAAGINTNKHILSPHQSPPSLYCSLSRTLFIQSTSASEMTSIFMLVLVYFWKWGLMEGEFRKVLFLEESRVQHSWNGGCFLSAAGPACYLPSWKQALLSECRGVLHDTSAFHKLCCLKTAEAEGLKWQPNRVCNKHIKLVGWVCGL